MDEKIKRREIGGEFWDIPQKEECALFPDRTEWFISGRWALRFVLEDIQSHRTIRTAALPSWCCHTMIQPFLDRGISVRFYQVLPAPCGGIQIDFSQAENCDILLIMDYFGYEQRTSLSGFRGVLIRDATHSLFTSPHKEGDYVFGSLRKWAGFWTGGYAWKREGHFLISPPEKANPLHISLRRRAMAEKLEYLEGRSANKDYLSVFAEAENLLDVASAEIGAAERDIAGAKKLDIAFLRQKRRENAEFLLNGVSHMALFPSLGEKDCPLFVPILVQGGKRDALRSFLIEREIYCPIHWPVSSLHHLTRPEQRLYEEELSLVCDQRYGPANMERILQMIEDFFRREI